MNEMTTTASMSCMNVESVPDRIDSINDIATLQDARIPPRRVYARSSRTRLLHPPHGRKPLGALAPVARAYGAVQTVARVS